MTGSASQDGVDRRLRQARKEYIRERIEAPVMALEGYAEMMTGHFPELDRELSTSLAADRERIESAIETLKALVAEELERTDPDDAGQPDEDRAAATQRIRHDMRNALGAVSGYAEIIAETLEDAGHREESIAACLERLEVESSTLLRTIDELAPDPGAESSEGIETDAVEDILQSLEKVADSADELQGRILIVDDNDSNRALLEHRLAAQGHDTLSAASGRAALALMETEIPDLVLLDLMMPDMNGFEVLSTMHRREELRNVPVIVITGLQDQEGVVRCIEAGAQDYLIKPLNPVVLRARIRSCLERKAWRDREQNYQRELERSYAFIRKVFGRYLSDDVVGRILDEKDGLKLGGGLQRVTIMMTDLRGFTGLSQKLAPTDVVKLLNIYLEEMNAIIKRYDGTIDEIIGDAILALFGAPLVREDDASRAVACALEMQLAMEKVNDQARAAGLPALEMGIGLNTGEVVVGNIGSEVRSKYAVVGHHVNLTGRIESFTIGGQILASEYTVDAVGEGLECGRSFEVDAKGVEHPVTLHEVVGLGPPWSLRLARDDEQLDALEPPLSVRLSELSGKKLDGPESIAQIVALGSSAATLISERPLETLANIRLRVEAGNGAAGNEEGLEVYAKVTETAADGPVNRYHIALTSVDAGERLRACQRPQPDAADA
ncbi:MAG: adenylate/guanylate cyclase domain-containing protein [Wenzhouxiangella sp.]|jgi:class 3 adenylate cyclase|nr:adenylate/guanylate cyclase domain-containing protein [Wenzhouxiangella sp.]